MKKFSYIIREIKKRYKIDHIINLAAITGDQIKFINKKDVWKSVKLICMLHF